MKKIYLCLVGIFLSFIFLTGCNKEEITSLEFSHKEILVLKGEEIKDLKATPIYSKDHKGNLFDVTNEMISGYDKNKTGTQTITITYSKFETKVDVFVADKIVSTAAELRSAINTQADGVVVALKQGTYDIDRNDTRTYAGNTNYYFLITANNSIWKGFGDVTVKSSIESESAALATQNFVTITGDNVTFENINLQSKKEANKVIEIFGKDTTIRDLTISPIDTTHKFAGTIYLSTSTGNTTIENVEMKHGRISTSGASKQSTLTLKKVTIDFAGSTNIDGDAETSLWGYRNSANITVTATDSTISVSSTMKSSADYSTFTGQLPEGLTVKEK